ncbi:MAG: ATP-binding protein [Methylococcaceae bacterium]|nr:ATP-binding protein [Methylococcaceae bacterium]
MIATKHNPEGVTLSISSTVEQVCLLSVAIHALCLHASGDEASAMAVQCAVVEALNNVILHGYKNLPESDIIVHWTQTKAEMRIDIIDFGHSMTLLPEPVLPDFEAENGRGWWIINASVDEYYYQVVDTLERARTYQPDGSHDYSEAVNATTHYNKLTFIKRFS